MDAPAAGRGPRFDARQAAAAVLRRAAQLLPRRSDYAEVRASWRADLLAGLTVGVVALPLALAFGVTSGLGAASGLTTAIVAGLIDPRMKIEIQATARRSR